MCFVDNQSRDLVLELHRDRKQYTSKIRYGCCIYLVLYRNYDFVLIFMTEKVYPTL